MELPTAFASKRAGDDFVTSAHYTCCDMQLFHELVLGYFYGTKSVDAKVRELSNSHVVHPPLPVFAVVNNAGIVSGGAPILEADDARVVKTFQVRPRSRTY